MCVCNARWALNAQILTDLRMYVQKNVCVAAVLYEWSLHLCVCECEFFFFAHLASRLPPISESESICNSEVKVFTDFHSIQILVSLFHGVCWKNFLFFGMTNLIKSVYLLWSSNIRAITICNTVCKRKIKLSQAKFLFFYCLWNHQWFLFKDWSIFTKNTHTHPPKNDE